MSVHVMIAGSLFREPTQKTSKTGKPFVVATIKVAADNELQFWNVLAFSESAQAEILRLAFGEALTVQGSLKVETYTKDGEVKVNRTCFADNVLALRQPPRERKETNSKPARSAPAPSRNTGGPAPTVWDQGSDLNDDIPF
jgi:single-stranded DNA-binding protein